MKITIYTTSACAFCKMAKEFFDDNHVEYTEKDVSNDQDAAQEMIDRSGQMGVPVTIAAHDDKEEIIVGYDEERFAELISKK